MAKKQKAPDAGPSNAYLMSFGDTMTALLAFFIVLNSLAKEQTGANLHAGTGSFISASDSAGLPGTLSTQASKNAVQFDAPSPFYGAESNEGEENNSLRILDREREEFQRLLNEFERFYKVENLPSTRAAVVFDVFDRLQESPTPLSTNGRRMLNRSRAMLLRDGYEIEVVVWAPTPSRSAWIRSFDKAKQIVAQYAKEARLPDDIAVRLRPVSRSWMYSDEKRPTMSVVVINRRV